MTVLAIELNGILLLLLVRSIAFSLCLVGDHLPGGMSVAHALLEVKFVIEPELSGIGRTVADPNPPVELRMILVEARDLGFAILRQLAVHGVLGQVVVADDALVVGRTQERSVATLMIAMAGAASDYLFLGAMR